MDEMTEYRDRVERRQHERRGSKNERRQKRVKVPVPTDWLFIADLVFLAGITVALCYLN